jgi:hypothetical protein
MAPVRERRRVTLPDPPTSYKKLAGAKASPSVAVQEEVTPIFGEMRGDEHAISDAI